MYQMCLHSPRKVGSQLNKDVLRRQIEGEKKFTKFTTTWASQTEGRRTVHKSKDNSSSIFIRLEKKSLACSTTLTCLQAQ